MTKSELKAQLLSGKPLNTILSFRDGQECTIFKADSFCTDDHIIYIPDLDLNEIPDSLDLSIDNSMQEASNGAWGSFTAEEQVNLVLSYCYTGEDFCQVCGGDEALAYRLFCYVDWQHPSSAHPEVEYEDDADKQAAEEVYARWRKSNHQPNK